MLKLPQLFIHSFIRQSINLSVSYIMSYKLSKQSKPSLVVWETDNKGWFSKLLIDLWHLDQMYVWEGLPHLDIRIPLLTAFCGRYTPPPYQRPSTAYRDPDDPLLGQRTQPETFHGRGQEHHAWSNAGKAPSCKVAHTQIEKGNNTGATLKLEYCEKVHFSL